MQSEQNEIFPIPLLRNAEKTIKFFSVFFLVFSNKNRFFDSNTAFQINSIIFINDLININKDCNTFLLISQLLKNVFNNEKEKSKIFGKCVLKNRTCMVRVK